jgi:hypothetical protein
LSDHATPGSAAPDALRVRLKRLARDADRIHSAHADQEGGAWRSFIPSDHGSVYRALRSVPHGDGHFLEWGSGIGTITLMASLLGFRASGIEIEPELVRIARALAERHGLAATFVVGTFIPEWYEDNPLAFDPDMRSLVSGEDGYRLLSMDLDEFDVVYAFPWPGEEDLYYDLFRRGGRRGAHLICNLGRDGMRIVRHR